MTGSLAALQTRLLFKETNPLPADNVLFSGVTCSSVPRPHGVNGEGAAGSSPCTGDQHQHHSRGKGELECHNPVWHQPRVAPTQCGTNPVWHPLLLLGITLALPPRAAWVMLVKTGVRLCTCCHKVSQNHFFPCSKNIFISKFFRFSNITFGRHYKRQSDLAVILYTVPYLGEIKPLPKCVCQCKHTAFNTELIKIL